MKRDTTDDDSHSDLGSLKKHSSSHARLGAALFGQRATVNDIDRAPQTILTAATSDG